MLYIHLSAQGVCITPPIHSKRKSTTEDQYRAQYHEDDTVGLALVPDPNPLSPPNGKVQFLQLVGLTQAEINCLYEAHIVRMHADNRLPITNLRCTKNHI